MVVTATGYTRIPGLSTKNHRFHVPLDYGKPDGPKIEIFAREVLAPGNENRNLPWIVFFQGGPGFGAPRPHGPDFWIKRAIKNYRVLLLDQRGTGLSTPVLDETVVPLGEPQQQADYLKHFRADNIVRDAEYIRKTLAGGNKWTALGQSFGGFILTTYLSIAAEGLEAALITGGLPPLGDDPDEVYRRTYKRVIAKNRAYAERYPGDADVVRRVVHFLRNEDVRLPNGEQLSLRRFLQLGIEFGYSDGFETVHYLLEEAFSSSASRLGSRFCHQFSGLLQFGTNPIYALLHEAIYCQGRASNWSAERLSSEFEQFSLTNDVPLFTGEMVYSWMFDEYERLRPLKEAANILARFDSWGPLYNTDALNGNTVPTVATVYYDDMYVDLDLSMQTAAQINGCRTWITNEYEHNGIRADGARILDRMLAMLNGHC